MTLVNYKFPTITDLNFFDTASISSVIDDRTGGIPGFINFIPNSHSLAIYPTDITDIKLYTMIVMITDTKTTVEYSFKLNVTFQPPKFIESLVK